MSVVRWDPIAEMANLQRSISQLFDDFLASERRGAGFPVSVYETGDEVVVRADLPGVRPEDVQVQYDQGHLYIRATRQTHAPDGALWLVRESTGGEYTRAVSLGIPVDPDGIQAVLEHGVLEVRLPKAAEVRPKRIPVRSGTGSAPEALPPSSEQKAA
jgi:HSP20 family protein